MGSRPRDWQLSRVMCAVNTSGVWSFELSRSDRDLRLFQDVFDEAMRSEPVARMIGYECEVPYPVWVLHSKGCESKVTVERRIMYISDARLLCILAEHLAHRFHPIDEPLHGWRFARLLLALAYSYDRYRPPDEKDKVAPQLRWAYAQYGVKWQAPPAR